jgi:hypothetical protein
MGAAALGNGLAPAHNPLFSGGRGRAHDLEQPLTAIRLIGRAEVDLGDPAAAQRRSGPADTLWQGSH